MPAWGRPRTRRAARSRIRRASRRSCRHHRGGRRVRHAGGRAGGLSMPSQYRAQALVQMEAADAGRAPALRRSSPTCSGVARWSGRWWSGCGWTSSPCPSARPCWADSPRGWPSWPQVRPVAGEPGLCLGRRAHRSGQPGGAGAAAQCADAAGGAGGRRVPGIGRWPRTAERAGRQTCRRQRRGDAGGRHRRGTRHPLHAGAAGPAGRGRPHRPRTAGGSVGRRRPHGAHRSGSADRRNAEALVNGVANSYILGRPRCAATTWPARWPSSAGNCPSPRPSSTAPRRH